ncbi:extracellular solute-binding protein [Paenibacillus chungangensis]|uniref:Extracellular solute-binding protein n=1 Tax=Paenibacillus chungangensis TaxID=696535 RepID=A0ABW3HTX5_9BACL
MGNMKSSNTRKVAYFAILLAVLLASSTVFAGCSSNNEGENGSNKQTDSDKQTEGSGEQTIKLSVMAGTFGAVPENTEVQKEWQRRMEEYIGRKLDIDWQYIPWGDYSDKFKLTLASGDLPDIMTNTGSDLAVQYGRQGLVLDISKYLDQAPNYKAFLDSTPYVESSMYTPEGNMYFFGDGWSNTDNNQGSAYGSLYRFDTFQKHDIKIPETLDELYEAAKKLKQLYPDSYPVNAFPWPKVEEAFMLSNHVRSDIYWDGDRFTYGAVSEGYKEALMFANKLFNEKLLDPEIITQSEDQVKQKVMTGKSFIVPVAWYGFTSEFNSLGQDSMEWGGALVPDNPTYGKAWKMSSIEPGKLIRPYNGVLVSAKTKHPELIVKMLDYQYTDEMIDLLNWGIEGRTYEIKEGKKQYLPEILNAAIPSKALEPFGVGGSNRAGFIFSPQEFSADLGKYRPMPFFAEGKYMVEKNFIATDKYGGEESVAPYDRAPTVTLDKDEQAKRNETMTPIDTYVSEAAIKFIIGERSFDEWDKYKSEIKNLGDYEAIVKMMNDKAEAVVK